VTATRVVMTKVVVHQLTITTDVTSEIKIKE